MYDRAAVYLEWNDIVFSPDCQNHLK